MGTEKIVRKICFNENFLNLDDFITLATKLGYPMFAFNGIVYAIPSRTSIDLLDLPLFTTEDLGV